MIEEFKDIKNYEDVYQITSYGRVYNKVLKKFRKLSLSKDGYNYIDLWDNGIYCTFRVHRLVAEAFCYGQTKEKNLVNHKDLNKLNNYYKNLEWCSHQENINHAKENGAWKINQFAPSAILTNEEAKEYRKSLKDVGGFRRIILSPDPKYNLTKEDLKDITEKVLEDYRKLNTNKEYKATFAIHTDTEVKHAHILLTSKKGSNIKWKKEDLKTFKEIYPELKEDNYTDFLKK
jgi:hypothetical protein